MTFACLVLLWNCGILRGSHQETRTWIISCHCLLYYPSLVGCSVLWLQCGRSVSSHFSATHIVVLVAESQHIAALRQVQSLAPGFRSHCGHVAIWLNPYHCWNTDGGRLPCQIINAHTYCLESAPSHFDGVKGRPRQPKFWIVPRIASV